MEHVSLLACFNLSDIWLKRKGRGEGGGGVGEGGGGAGSFGCGKHQCRLRTSMQQVIHKVMYVLKSFIKKKKHSFAFETLDYD